MLEINSFIFPNLKRSQNFCSQNFSLYSSHRKPDITYTNIINFVRKKKKIVLNIQEIVLKFHENTVHQSFYLSYYLRSLCVIYISLIL